MYRKIVGYVPSTIIPAAVSFLMIYVYTRLLSPGVYGEFSFFFSVFLFLQLTFIFPIPIAITRFYPEAVAAGRRDAMLAECYSLFAIVSLFVLLLVLAVALWVLPHHSPMLWCMTVVLTVTRSLVVLNQAVNRITDRMARFNLVECSNAILGFGSGLVFILCFGGSAQAAIGGQIVAAVLCMCVDLRLPAVSLRFRPRLRGSPTFAKLVSYVVPLILVDVGISLLALSDRFMLSSLGSATMLGIYTVAFNLVERPTTLICTAISTATFPIAVQELQQHGRQAGRRQAGKNGAVLLALAIPACAGLALGSSNIAAVLIGPEFRAGVEVLIPIMCVTSLFRGVSQHFVDHAFHLAGRSMPALWVYMPPALANIALNLVLIPRFGTVGAAWAGLVCQGGAIALGCIIGRRWFPIWMPLWDIAKVVLAVVPMILVLRSVTFAPTWGGLLELVSLGAVVFGAGAAALDVCGARAMLVQRVPSMVEWRRHSTLRHAARSRAPGGL